jgi:hypothetical protein
MSYMTVEVEIDHGHIVAKGVETLPERASGLLTILGQQSSPQPHPIGLAKGQFTVPEDFNASLQALEALQKHLQLDAKKAAEWKASLREL